MAITLRFLASGARQVLMPSVCHGRVDPVARVGMQAPGVGHTVDPGAVCHGRLVVDPVVHVAMQAKLRINYSGETESVHACTSCMVRVLYVESAGLPNERLADAIATYAPAAIVLHLVQSFFSFRGRPSFSFLLPFP